FTLADSDSVAADTSGPDTDDNGTTAVGHHHKHGKAGVGLFLPIFMTLFLVTVLLGLLAIVYLCFCMPITDGQSDGSALSAKQKLQKTTKQGKLGAFQPKHSMGVIFLNEEIKQFHGGPSDRFPASGASAGGKRAKGKRGRRSSSKRSSGRGTTKKRSFGKGKTAPPSASRHSRSKQTSARASTRKALKSRSKSKQRGGKSGGPSKSKSAVVAKESELGRASLSFYRQFLKSVHTVKSVSEYRFLQPDGGGGGGGGQGIIEFDPLFSQTFLTCCQPQQQQSKLLSLFNANSPDTTNTNSKAD
ncbi:hypothetical protein TYRP_000778, partial [Tyrophagus putrescentiae]